MTYYLMTPAARAGRAFRSTSTRGIMMYPYHIYINSDNIRTKVSVLRRGTRSIRCRVRYSYGSPARYVGTTHALQYCGPAFKFSTGTTTARLQQPNRDTESSREAGWKYLNSYDLYSTYLNDGNLNSINLNPNPDPKPKSQNIQMKARTLGPRATVYCSDINLNLRNLNYLHFKRLIETRNLKHQHASTYPKSEGKHV